jgi:hypothetical protein
MKNNKAFRNGSAILRRIETSAMQGHSQKSTNGFSRLRGYWTEERSLTVLLLLLVLHIFVLTPATFLGRAFQIIGALFLVLMLAEGLLTMVKLKVLRWIGAVIVAGVVLFKFAALFWSVPWLIIGDILFMLFSLSALAYIVFLQISKEGPVTAHLLRGAIAEYLLIAMFFAFLYSLIEKLVPGAFTISGSPDAHGETFYYFSIITLTTVGFGDITPVHPFVRSLVMSEALIGQLYPVVMLSRLVTLEMETRRSGRGGD